MDGKQKSTTDRRNRLTLSEADTYHAMLKTVAEDNSNSSQSLAVDISKATVTMLYLVLHEHMMKTGKSGNKYGRFKYSTEKRITNADFI